MCEPQVRVGRASFLFPTHVLTIGCTLIALVSCVTDVGSAPPLREESVDSWIQAECADRALDLPLGMDSAVRLSEGGVSGVVFVDRTGRSRLVARRYSRADGGFPSPPWASQLDLPEPPPPDPSRAGEEYVLDYPEVPLRVHMGVGGEVRVVAAGEVGVGFGAFVERLLATPRRGAPFENKRLKTPDAVDVYTVVIDLDPGSSAADCVAFVQLVDLLAPSLFRIYAIGDSEPLPELTAALAKLPRDVDEHGDLLVVVDGRCSFQNLRNVLQSAGSAGLLLGRLALVVRHRGGGLRKICFYLPYA